MKAMIEGVWRTDVEPTHAYRAAAERARFRDWVQADGSSAFAPEPGRYHLYVSYACPFAHRTLLGRALLGLERAVSVSVLDPDWGGPMGWVFGRPPAATPDHVNGLSALPEVYRKANPRFTGKVTVPALWDRERATIVNNESAEILRMLEVEFRALASSGTDLYPEALRPEIDEVNAFVGPRINGGVYRAGFAATQEAYDAAVLDLFAALDAIEERLATRRFLVGERLRRTCACSRRWSASTLPTTARCAATSGASPTTRTSWRTRGGSTPFPGWPRRSGSITSSGTTGTTTR